MGRVADIEEVRRLDALVRTAANRFEREVRATRLTNIAVKRYILRDQPVPVDLLARLHEQGIFI